MGDWLEDPRLDWGLLEQYRFDRARFLADATAFVARRASTESACIIGRIECAGTIDDLDDARARKECLLAGIDALRSGRVAVVVLNGGMATRFGGVAKGVVPVFGDLSFLGLAAKDVALASALYGASIPLVIMNSFATRPNTLAHLRACESFGLPSSDVLGFEQSISIRLDRSGELFIGRDGMPSYYAPGHGDFFASIRASGVLARLWSVASHGSSSRTSTTSAPRSIRSFLDVTSSRVAT